MADLVLEREVMTLFEQLLEVPETQRETWIEAHTLGRPALRERLVALEAADRLDSLHTGGAITALESAALPERIGPYRILERIGQRGMGAVYRAERDAGDFSRTVAIKVIKPGLFTPELVSRFESERQTLARLSHPNIAQLFDGGQTVEGSPYFVMELVEGLALLQWIAAAPRSKAERTQLFLDICAAAAFAHSHLVVHRDLTPNNVLVRDDGVVKLIDFGIARPADEAPIAANDARIAALTHTPGYAAPERLRGGHVTTAADIYSLGQLLANIEPTHRKDRELQAIIARASADEPTARYPSVASLIADVEAWRSGRQVSAYGRAPLYVFKKFVARHRIAFAATAIAFAVLVAAFANTLIANVRAEHARELAEARFEQTRAIANSMLFDVFDEVSLTVGSTNAREMLARTSLTYLEALAADDNAPLDVQVEAGLGFLRLSQVVGGGQVGELGRYQDASALLAKAEQIIEPLYAAHPQDERIAHAMAQLLLEQSGAALYNDNDSAAGRAYAERAAAAIEPYARDDADAARTYAIALQAVADSFGWDDDYTTARDHHLRAEAFATSLPATIRDHVKIMRARAANLRLLGEAYHRLEQEDEARVVLDQAVDLNRAVRDSAPNNPGYIRNFAISTWYRAVVHRSNERIALARASIEESVASARILRERDPNDAGAIRMLAISNEVYAQVLADLGDFAGSYSTGSEVIAAHRELVRRADGAPGARRSLAAALMTHGGNSYNGGSYARACEAWIEARGIYRALNAEGALGERDRNASLAEAEDFVRRGCGPPRRGLGDAI